MLSGAARSAAAGSTYDVCVVGSGAAGAVIADRCVRAGLSVLMIEQGAAAPAGTSYWDARDCWGAKAFGRIRTGGLAEEARAWTSCNVGGGTIYYGGASFRLRERDFDASAVVSVRRQKFWDSGALDLAEDWARLGLISRRRFCGAASADVRGSVA